MYLIIFNGPSGGGKTTMVHLLKSMLEKDSDLSVNVLSMDNFYKSAKDHESGNWDDISAFDLDILYEKVHELKQGKEVYIPKRDFATHTQIPNAEKIGKTDVLILEGIFTLYDKKIRDMADLKVYVDADPYTSCFQRRIGRDMSSRSRSLDSVLKQYTGQVLGGYERYVKPYKRYADLYYCNEDSMPSDNTLFLKLLNNHVLKSYAA